MSQETQFSQEVADAICERIADGKSLRSICEEEGMPARSTVFKWLNNFPEFVDQYARSRDEQADALADDMLAIADQYDSVADALTPDLIQRAKLRIDTRKWIAAKLKPKKYGDKLDIDQKTTLEASDPLTMLLMQIAETGRKITDKP